MNTYEYETVIGGLRITENGAGVTGISFIQQGQLDMTQNKDTWLIQEVKKQLDEYFAGERRMFDLPLEPSGTEFQKKVWKTLVQIPYAQTVTYGEIARQIGNEKASRAVGNANNKNPIAILVPCHRVIGASGKLVGYAGGLDIKEYLLDLEKGYN